MVKDFDGAELKQEDLMLAVRTASALLARETGLLTGQQVSQLLGIPMGELAEAAEDMAEAAREAWEQQFGGPDGAA